MYMSPNYSRFAIGRGQTMNLARQARRNYRAGAMGQMVPQGYYQPYGSHPSRYAIGACPPVTAPCPPQIPVCNPDQKRILLSFRATGVAAGATVTITASPQTLFRPDQFVVPSNIGVNFDVNDIVIGNRSQLSASGATSAVVFSEVSVNSQVRFDTAQPGVDIILSVTNTSAGALDFSATMFGPAVQGM